MSNSNPNLQTDKGIVDGLQKPRIDLSKPRWSQETFIGRFKHFLQTTDPRNAFVSEKQLDAAKDLVQSYKLGSEPPGTTEEQLWHAKKLYDSAFHPSTGEKMLTIGRMSAQVPCNMTITGLMMTFYRTTPAVLFWQWANQSFNAVVNYTNRSGKSMSYSELALPYVCATTGAVGTALGLNSLVKKAPPVIGRFTPFAAVAAANCINIPMMRQSELTEGIMVQDNEGNNVGKSKKAAKKAIGQVVFSRIIMCAPGMILPAWLMDKLEKGKFLKRYPYMGGPIQIVLVGIALTVMTPACCAIFPQKSSMAVGDLEPELRTEIVGRYGNKLERVYFNKGL
ncbi:Sideroflexin-1 [Trichoplax sp. H2]|uniref:Sidoreflexin n=1 Tax=Trichoplax adhaerens TaxID=10228 RepID=B3S978_TRIAD|nr:hypothetical protein TRIADDRAFT_31298 [Trichoplax adhaerens]EDV20754.1 hypothetical protein TRIADDRAFT_31298 [Trichoplax adhaerens]RDD37263.1 Sideroflexin-1 [Trichoplax sp. H2]|eukprot:XP_002116695.1 hypothetical protein TRIADDRAFT_31298 [Trichoplax adhaerens]